MNDFNVHPYKLFQYRHDLWMATSNILLLDGFGATPDDALANLKVKYEDLVKKYNEYFGEE